MVDEGKLDWDTPVFNYVPEFTAYDPYMTRWLTTRDLLAHRTGWPEFTGDILDNFGYSRAEILHRLRYLEPAYSLREVAQYSNPGFFVAGEVAARASGLSWNELVEQRLYAPMGMTRSGTLYADLQDANATAAHALAGEQTVLVQPTNQDTMGAAGSATSTAADMARWLQMLLNDGKYGETQVLQPGSVAEDVQAQYGVRASFAELPPIGETTGFYYGLGVASFDYAGVSDRSRKAARCAGVRTMMDADARARQRDRGAGQPQSDRVSRGRASVLDQPAAWHRPQYRPAGKSLTSTSSSSSLLDPPAPPAEPWPVQRTAELAGRHLREPALRALQHCA